MGVLNTLRDIQNSQSFLSLELCLVFFLIFYRLHSALSQPLLEGKGFLYSVGIPAIVQCGVFFLFYFHNTWVTAVNYLVPEPYLVCQTR